MEMNIKWTLIRLEVKYMDANGIKLTPKDIVSKLDEYIVGQDDAKRKLPLL